MDILRGKLRQGAYTTKLKLTKTMKFTQKAIDYINSIEIADERIQKSADLEKAANRIARKHGMNAATKIDVRFDRKDVVTECTHYGYVKDSTGEYVSKAYVNKCFGKGVSYKHAVCEVSVSVHDLFLKI